MGTESPPPVVHECMYRCKSKRHGSNLTAAITKDEYTDDMIASYWKWCCVRYFQAIDENGRTLLHMAAAKGRVELLIFLLKHRDINLHIMDNESHFTPLHTSIYYGYINCAVHLIKAGASIEQLDLDELSPLDHITADRPVNIRELEFTTHDVYVWGNNVHSILGTGDDQRIEEPEPIEAFIKQKLFFKQIILSEQHSAFLARDGRLWMCGNGEGGRLGLGDETTATTPKVVNTECHAVAIGADHTLMVMGNKTVWSFGLNTYHQLGHDPPPDKVLVPKFVRGLRHVGIVGVSASKFHSAFWSENRLFTCGLNGGQLGHTRDSGKTVVVPKAVSGLRQCSIKTVVCTYGATILANNYGEIYLFYDYVCRKITSRPFYPKIVCAIGGHVDHTLDTLRLEENTGKELQVLVVTTCNTVYIWKESDRRYLKYELNFRVRTLHINDLAFHDDSLVLTTRDGKAYTGVIIGKRTTGSKLHSGSSKNRIFLRRIPYIYRAGLVTVDPTGQSFAVTQYQPKSRLYNFPRPSRAELDEHVRNLFRVLNRAEYFQDVVFEVEGAQFWGHRYIVGHASKILEDMMNEAVRPDGTCVVKLENVGAQVFRSLLCYIYTRDFNLISTYKGKPRSDSDSKKSNTDGESESEVFDMNSSFEYNSVRYEAVVEKPMTGKEKGLYMKSLERAANVYGVIGLREEFDGNDMLFKRQRVYPSSLVKFERERLTYLYDITLRSSDGLEIQCHKCVLISRLQYFNSMINNKSWIESTLDVPVQLPISGKILTILVNFLYTGTAPLILKTEDLDLIFATLILADQIFCYGLKNICEFTLSQLLNFENAAEILCMATVYNADDLRFYVSEFICQNLGYLLETRLLDEIPGFIIKDFSTYYRSRVPRLSDSRINTYHNAPDVNLITMITETEPVSVANFDGTTSLFSAFESPGKKRSRYFIRSQSFDSLLSGTCWNTSQKTPGAHFDMENGYGAGRSRVVNRSTRHHNFGEWKLLTPDEVLNMTSDLVDEDNYVCVRVAPLKAFSMNSVMDIQYLSSSSERNFPALKPCCSERNIESYPPSVRPNALVSEKVLMFSRGNEERRNRRSANKVKRPIDSDDDEPVTDYPCYSYYWRGDHDAMSSSSSEGSMSDSSVGMDFPIEDDPHGLKPGRPVRMKLKAKLHYQLEEKAMKELLAYYNADNVKDERITVRRAEYGYHLSPARKNNTHLVTPRDPR